MLAREFWKAVTVDESNVLERFFALLEGQGVRYCLIDGQAVNAYADPVVSLDLNIVLAGDAMERLEPVLAERFRIERFPHSLNVSDAGSALRIQIQLDPRYADFVTRASLRAVLGHELPVAAVEDVLQGKVWAAQDPARRASKRLKDLSDIARLIEAQPRLRERVPADILDRLC
ncbi:MAG TPA: nucleotidyl transferase AbiEii/AbiGii toxin family protein [Vicinamibacterales bacterium]|nr:nucleotidyl transferase AbiEii/AbiGii toxin family protein [Vicinamibacterales bacterium]